MTEMPVAIRRVEAEYPWQRVVERSRQRLTELAPELSEAVASLDGKVFGLTSGFFYLPAAQAEAWGLDDVGWTEDLLTILAIGHAHFAVQDTVVDTGSCAPDLSLLSDVCLLEYLDGLDQLAPAGFPSYRPLHDTYYRWYLRGVLNELAHRKNLYPYTPREISQLGLKAAPGNTTIHLVADMAGCGSRAELAVRAVMHLCTGLQLLDDLNDIDEDYRDRNLTMPLTATLGKMRDHAYPDPDPSPRDLGVIAAFTGVASACINIAKEYFVLAQDSANEVDAGVIASLARTWYSRAEERRDLIANALAGEARTPQ